MSLNDDDKLWIAERFDVLGQRIEETTAAQNVQLEQRIAETTAAQNFQLETKLLTEFHKWASPVEQKLRSHREALRALDLQIEAIADRVAKLEAERERPH